MTVRLGLFSQARLSFVSSCARDKSYHVWCQFAHVRRKQDLRGTETNSDAAAIFSCCRQQIKIEPQVNRGQFKTLFRLDAAKRRQQTANGRTANAPRNSQIFTLFFLFFFLRTFSVVCPTPFLSCVTSNFLILLSPFLCHLDKHQRIVAQDTAESANTFREQQDKRRIANTPLTPPMISAAIVGPQVQQDKRIFLFASRNISFCSHFNSNSTSMRTINRRTLLDAPSSSCHDWLLLPMPHLSALNHSHTPSHSGFYDLRMI